MKQVLHVNSVNDYARHVGAEVLHPLVSVIHYDELEHCRHSLNHYGVYGLFMMERSPYTLTYGLGQYKSDAHSMICVAPGQMGGVTDNGEVISLHGWVLLFSPLLIANTSLRHRMEDYHFFSYYQSEALHILPDEWDTLEQCMKMIRHELKTHPDSPRQHNILVAHIELILEYSMRCYQRQFEMEAVSNNDLLKRFENLLRQYYKENRQAKHGIPTVRYCAQELFLSPNYFGDLIHQLTGTTASKIIQSFILQHARELMLEGKSVTETSEWLGFEYPQYFTRLFKKHFGVPPSQHLCLTDK